MRSPWQTELGFVAAQALMETLLLWLLVTLLQHNAGMLASASFGGAWVLQLCAAALAWTFRRFQLRAALLPLLLLAAGAALLATAQSTPEGILSGYLCVRGLFIGTHIDRPKTILRSFKLGSGACVLLFAFIALSGTPRQELPYDQLRQLGIAYLFFGTALAGLHQRRMFALSPAALVSILAPTFTLLCISVLLVFGPHAAGWVVRSGAIALNETASLVGEALGVLGTWLADSLRWFGRLFQPMSGTAAPPRAPVDLGPPGLWNTLIRSRTIALRVSSSEAVALLLLLLGVLTLVHVLVSLAKKRTPTVATLEETVEQEEQHTTLSWRSLLGPLAHLRRKRSASQPLAAAELSSLRAIYSAWLTWVAQHGHAREPSTTPSELAQRVSAQHPAQGPALSELTAFYSKERYAEELCTVEEQARARELMHELTR